MTLRFILGIMRSSLGNLRCCNNLNHAESGTAKPGAESQRKNGIGKDSRQLIKMEKSINFERRIFWRLARRIENADSKKCMLHACCVFREKLFNIVIFSRL